MSRFNRKCWLTKVQAWKKCGVLIYNYFYIICLNLWCITGCLQNQANKIPGFLQDFQEFFKEFPGFVCTKYFVYPNEFVLTIIIWNVQFHLAYFYLTTSSLTLTEADIYWAGSLLPEILLTTDPVYPTTDPVYPIDKISTNVDKYRL